MPELQCLAVVLFEPRGLGASEQQRLDEAFGRIGLARSAQAYDGSKVDLPRNAYAGALEGLSTADAADAIEALAREALRVCGVTGTLACAVAERWVWKIGTVEDGS